MVPQLDRIDTCDPAARATNVTSDTVTVTHADAGDTNAISISSTLSVATSGFTSQITLKTMDLNEVNH